MNDLPVRKTNRLHAYDYSRPGIYFITICTLERTCIFGQVHDGEDTETVELTEYGRIAEAAVVEISHRYANVEVLQHCVMPNHVHLLLQIHDAEQKKTVSWVVNQFKGAVTKQIGIPVWQKGFHDHVVRNETEFQRFWEYVTYNPAKWKLDGYYVAP